MKIFVETDKGTQQFCKFIIVGVADTFYKVYDKDGKICIEPIIDDEKNGKCE